ncbi:hypothetical protein ASL83_003476 [Vibrio parahaemolyticus]|nr:hypothetical protein [Vibrio parahaemolyticus]
MNPVQLHSNLDSSITPKQGDVVIPLAGNHIGCHALICHHPDITPEHVYIGYRVTGNKEPGEFDAVSCSGGPFNEVPISELTLIGTKKQQFLDSRVVTGPNRYDKYEEEVNVWTYTPDMDTQISLGRKFNSYQELLDDAGKINGLILKHREMCLKFAAEANDYQSSERRVLRGDHEVTGMNHRFHDDQLALVMFSAYKNNRRVTLYKNRDPESRFLYVDQLEGVYIASDIELDAILEAYDITDTEYDEENRVFSFTPNINVDSWAPFRVVPTSLVKHL